MTKNYWLILIITVILIIGGIYLFAQKKEPNALIVPSVSISRERDVVIENFSFSPLELKIKKEEAVAWLNKDSAAHTIVSDSGNELSSATLSKGKTYFHAFNSTGTFAYHCGIHPSMKARIIVE